MTSAVAQTPNRQNGAQSHPEPNKPSKPRDRHADFRRVMQRRVNNVLYDLDLLAYLSNRTNYTYTEDEVKQVFGLLQARLDSIRGMFVITQDKGDSADKRAQFSFDD